MRWSYKTVHYEMKKEGLLGSTFLDESEIEMSLNEYGKAGWELVSLLETLDGITAVFKQPLSLDREPAAPSGRAAGSLAKEKQPIKREPVVPKQKEPLRPESAAQQVQFLEEEDLLEEEVGSTELETEQKENKEASDVGSIRIE